MTVEERIEAADRRKVDGNELFKEGKIAAAMQQYEMVDLLFFRFYLDPAKISHIQVLVSYFFPTPCIKLKLGLQICGRQLIVTQLDQSNYLANQNQGAVNKYKFTVFMRLPGILQALGRCAFFQGHSSVPVGPPDMTAAPHPKFPVQGHIVSTGGAALRPVGD
jgi:hypothetical protein